jgi:DNA-binding XRE family transcriptional regulator
MTAQLPGPISKKYRQQTIIFGYALAITASSIRFGTIPITIVMFWPLSAEHQPLTCMRRKPSMAVQLIKDNNGKTQYVVIPYDEYFRMCLQMAEIDDETDDDLEDIEVEHDSLDDVELPGEVCSIMTWQNVSLQAAWRILRGMSQQEVADKLDISQSAVSQLEALDSRPQKRTREKLAAIYGCKQEQISLYLPKEG